MHGAALNKVLTTRSFWQPYLTLTPKDVSAEEVAAQFEGLRRDYVVRDEKVHYEYAGQQRTVAYGVVEFQFSCGERFSLLIDYQPSVDGCERSLYLIDSRSGEKHQMGWWDLARWHPYCLRMDELDDLVQFWRRQGGRPENVELPLLLLCQFVGLADQKDLEALSAKAEDAYRKLGLPALSGNEPNVPLQAKDGYRWEIDEELGWVFTSDEYCCYSIRNKPHADSDEGQFPFFAFREMMTGIRHNPQKGK